MVAHDNRNSEQRRLDDVMSATRDEATADKCYVGKRVQGCELADRVHQKHSSNKRIAAPQRTSPEPDSKPIKQRRHLAEPLGMTRRQNHKGARMASQNIFEGLQKDRF